MDTLKRIKSFRRGRAKSEFVLTVTDVGLDFHTLYQPTTVVASVIRHRHTSQSRAVLWEASLKSPKDGFCFWHPPFATSLEVSLATTGSKQDDRLHKDVYVAVEDVDKRGRRKLLAKTRIDLLDYVGRGRGGVMVDKLKLHPETKKVAKCYANISIQESSTLNKEEEEEEELQSADGRKPTDLISRVTAGRQSLSSSTAASSSRASERGSQRSLSSLPSQNSNVAKLDPGSLRTKDAVGKCSMAEEDDFDIIRRIAEASTPVDEVAKSIPVTPPEPRVEKRLAISSIAGSDSPLAHKTPGGGGVGGGGGGEDEQILRWAKDVLRDYTQIKITNLNSSWRNGLGFCALIHSRYPDLIPYATLKGHNGGLNCRLALSASRLIGVDVPKAADAQQKQELAAMLNTKTISTYLGQLKTALSQAKVELEESEVLQWQRRWFEEEDLFSDKFSRESSLVKGYSFEEAEEPPDSSPAAATEVTANRSRVLDLISEALADDKEEESPANLSHITKELKLLELENDRITHEQSLLEQVIRQDTDNDAVLPRYLKLVNEKNGLVRRQMQLNILEKEENLARQQLKLEREIQKLSAIADEKKTELNREREQALLQQLLALVNEKNELVLHLDNQEKAMADDETIEASLGRGNGLRGDPRKEECVLQ